MTSVLVVDDSRFMRTVLETHLEEHGFAVTTARNGEDALEYVRNDNPDVITMDVEMPEMGGIEAVERVMDENPTPIIMLSAHTDEDADATLEAIQRGAVECIPKPGGEVSVNTAQIIEELSERIRAIKQTTPKLSLSQGNYPEKDVVPSPMSPPTILIGASTGGPSLIQSIMADLPVSLNARVLIVQHMPASFTGRFAERIDENSGYDVSESRSSGSLKPGEAVIARGGTHLVVSDDDGEVLKYNLSDAPPQHGSRPSIDVLLESASQSVLRPCVSVLLTGMGSDGTSGAKHIKNRGGSVIAQDEATSAVFGIPKRAIEADVVDDIHPASELVGGIIESVNRLDSEQ